MIDDRAKAGKAGFFFTFILGRSIQLGDEPDGFGSTADGCLALEAEDAKWLAAEAQRIPTLLALASRSISSFADTASHSNKQRCTFLLMRGRLRPALQVFAPNMLQPPSKQVVEAAAASIGLVGGREWVYWLADTDEGVAEGSVNA
jgi:hypothetical protein